MPFALLLDENLEHDLLRQLRASGHDAEHVARTAALGKGATDREVAALSRRTGRVLLTRDDDFVTALSDDAYYGVLYVPDDALTPGAIVTILDRMDRHYDQDELRGADVLDTDWL